MAVDRHIIRRVGKDHFGPILAKQQVIGADVERAAAQQTMRSQSPEIIRARHRRRRHVGDVVFGAGRLPRRLGGFVERDVDVGCREAGDLDIEVELDQPLQLNGEDLAIPAGLLGQPVVGEHVGPLLGLGEMREPNGRDGGEADQLGRLDPSVTGDDLAGIVDQHRVRKAEPFDAVGDLPDLLLRMSARVVLIGLQPAQRAELDLLLAEAGDVAQLSTIDLDSADARVGGR
jgi:hypothetical protein